MTDEKLSLTHAMTALEVPRPPFNGSESFRGEKSTETSSELRLIDHFKVPFVRIQTYYDGCSDLVKFPRLGGKLHEINGGGYVRQRSLY